MSGRSIHSVGTAIAALLTVIALFAPATATAAGPGLLFKVPEDGRTGTGAGRLDLPRGVAADPTSGHFFVAEQLGRRISEFSPWGEFVKAWGWGVLDGSPELQVCSGDSGCLPGVGGLGPGQISSPRGMAVDADGDIYVHESEGSIRVQKFDADGNLLLIVGGEVNKTASAEPGSTEAERNLCTAADIEAGDICGSGVPGAGDGQFGAVTGQGNAVAVRSDGSLLVGDIDRIQEFTSEGVYVKDIALPLSRPVMSLAVQPGTGDILADFLQSYTNEAPESPDIYRYDGSKWSLFAQIGFPKHLAVSVDGHVFASVVEKSPPGEAVVEFDAGGKCVVCLGSGFARPEVIPLASTRQIHGVAVNQSGPGSSLTGNLYVSVGNGAANLAESVSYVDVYGPPPILFSDPPLAAPSIEEQFAVSVGTDSATLRAKINPRFWADTKYHVEYGPQPCEAGGCTRKQPLPPGDLLTGAVVRAPVTSGGVFLPGLEPDTRYFYRFVASSGGGGPVTGAGGDESDVGMEGTFLTFPRRASLQGNCVNQARRTGASSYLPDCRAYELVSPIDKDNGDIIALQSHARNFARLVQSSIAGESLTYSSYRAFGDAASAPYTSQYIAHRSSEGWRSNGISPRRESGSFYPEGGPFALLPDYKLFSPDLSAAWLRQDNEPTLDDVAPPGFTGLYKRDNGTGAYSSLIGLSPTKVQPGDFTPELQGVSMDGDRALIRANERLTGNGSSATVGGVPIHQLYLASAGTLRLVSALPNGNASSVGATAGTVNSTLDPEISSSLENALSDDGRRVYWSERGGVLFPSGPGPLFLRENAEQPQSAVSGGQCTEPAKACTVRVTSDPAQFWTASTNGSRALYTVGESLYRFDTAHPASPTLIAEEVLGVLGADVALSRIYFVSRASLTGGQENSEGSHAEAGAPNLYLDQAGGQTFIGTLSEADARSDTAGLILSPVNMAPSKRVARVTPSGGQIAFAATAKLTGYDNADRTNGEISAEVFHYDADQNRLLCISCNPSGARPAARGDLSFGAVRYWRAAGFPAWTNSLHAPVVMSDDGQTLFFESYDALVPRDTNSARDVYQWQRVAGKVDCESRIGAELHVAAAAGCISLISTGEDAADAELLEGTPGGSDVFFATSESLVPDDPGLVDIYDARVNGGIEPLPAAATPCEGDACQGPVAPPRDVAPASANFHGPSKAAGGKRHCRPGQRKVRRGGKVPCVKKHSNKHRRKSGAQGGSRR